MFAIGRHITKLTGYAPELPTPFTEDDRVDYETFEWLRDLQIMHGATALVHDVPSRTVRGLTDESMARLAEAPRIIGLYGRDGRRRPSIAAARPGLSPATTQRLWDSWLKAVTAAFPLSQMSRRAFATNVSCVAAGSHDARPPDYDTARAIERHPRP